MQFAIGVPLTKKATWAMVPSLSLAVALSVTGWLTRKVAPLVGLVRVTVGGRLTRKVEFCAPGVPLATVDDFQLAASVLSQTGFINSSEGPVPSAAVGQGASVA